jgi:photosystem II stability/assembly factor-like uncharacterized protein
MHRFFSQRNCLSACPLLLLASAIPLTAAPHWDIQYRYRQLDSTLTINDIAFPSATRGVVAGFITDRKQKDRPVVMVTSDGGANWSEVVVKETGLSLFFLDDSTGWMVTDKGIWATSESGRTWTKLKNSPAAMTRLWFLDRQHGFAAGLEKRVFETKDAGDTWTLLPILEQVEGNPTYTTFGEIAFAGDRGIISGWNIPPRRGGPEWMEAGTHPQRREIPHYAVLLETQDAGKTWTKSDTSVFGQISRISLTPQGTGLGLLEFHDEFEYPSEVEKINLHTGRSDRTFREKDRAITDVRLFAGSNKAIIAGYETAGTIYHSPIPGKVKILTSDDLDTWTEMEVDYRAVGHSVLLAGPDEEHVWAATDTGMILKLTAQ